MLDKPMEREEDFDEEVFLQRFEDNLAPIRTTKGKI